MSPTICWYLLYNIRSGDMTVVTRCVQRATIYVNLTPTGSTERLHYNNINDNRGAQEYVKIINKYSRLLSARDRERMRTKVGREKRKNYYTRDVSGGPHAVPNINNTNIRASATRKTRLWRKDIARGKDVTITLCILGELLCFLCVRV